MYVRMYVCTYIYIYHNVQVVGDPLQNNRLVICEVVAAVMKQALWILGITPLEKL